MKILAVIPSLSVGRLEHVVSIAQDLTILGIDPVVVANGRKIDAALANTCVNTLSPRRNLGFGAAVNLAAKSVSDWNWLLIMNDDIELDRLQFGSTIERYLGDSSEQIVVYFDDEPVRRLPTSIDVFRSLALLTGVTKHLRVAGREEPRKKSSLGTYKAFSLVAISRAAWMTSGGFDERFAFSYEDSDFVRRGIQAETRFLSAEGSGAHHLHSVTGRAYVDTVLPVSAWCGYQYLVKWGQPSSTAKFLCLAALIVRLPLIPLVQGSPRKHILGNIRAFVAILRDRVPALPDFEMV